MANNTERMRIAAQVLTATGGIGGGGGPKPPGKGTVSERGGELNAAQAVGSEVDKAGGEQALSPGKQFRVTQFRQQFAGSGSVGGSANIYLADPNDAREDVIRFEIAFEFINENGDAVPMRHADKMARVTASGGQVAWDRPFFTPLFGLPTNAQRPVLDTLNSARLRNDQTFEYFVAAGVRFDQNPVFIPLLPVQPPRDFFIKPREFKLPVSGRIRVTIRAERDSRVFQANRATLQADVNAAKRQIVRDTGVSEQMLHEVRGSAGLPSTGSGPMTMFWFTGALRVHAVARVSRDP